MTDLTCPLPSSRLFLLCLLQTVCPPLIKRYADGPVGVGVDVVDDLELESASEEENGKDEGYLESCVVSVMMKQVVSTMIWPMWECLPCAHATTEWAKFGL